MDSYRFYLLARTYHSFCWMMMVTVDLVFMVEVAYLDPLQIGSGGDGTRSVHLPVRDPHGRRGRCGEPEGLRHHRSRHDRCGIPGEALWPTFGLILLSQVIWGVGHTFTSGAC